MCGILGIINPTKEVLQRLQTAFDKIEHRGKDAYGIQAGQASDKKTAAPKITEDPDEFSKNLAIEIKNKRQHIILHNLHAIIGKVPQPLSGKGVLAYNGEIYNWKKLAKDNKTDAKNDTEMIFSLLEKQETLSAENVNKILDNLDGVYATVYLREGKLILCRDMIGEKPLVWHHDAMTGMFAFASEGKALRELGLPFEILEPRTLMIYDLKTGQATQHHRRFLKITDKKSTYDIASRKKIAKTLAQKLISACEKRLADIDDVGILFSGGIDSTVLATICKKLGKKFTCYTAGYCDGDMNLPNDYIYAKKIAQEMGFSLKSKIIKTDMLDSIFTEVVSTIETDDVMKVGVATPFHICAKMARDDGKKVILSGLGSEELFAGYERHQNTLDKSGYSAVNKECLAGLYDMWQRDLYRDDLVMMSQTLELRLPFLDKELIEYALKIPAELKIDDRNKKIILREAARELEVPEEFARRKKQAAQYGSNFDKALTKMSKKHGTPTKAEYLRSLKDMRAANLEKTLTLNKHDMRNKAKQKQSPQQKTPKNETSTKRGQK
jgi:asparagine synthase (glutamine-hydrolysing)